MNAPSTAVYSGTATIDLGQAPAGATGVEVELTCLTEGKFVFPDGANVSCSSSDLGTRGAWSKYVVALEPSTQGVTITTDTGNGWQISARYIAQAPTEWKINAKGESYERSKGLRVLGPDERNRSGKPGRSCQEPA